MAVYTIWGRLGSDPRAFVVPGDDKPRFGGDHAAGRYHDPDRLGTIEADSPGEVVRLLHEWMKARGIPTSREG